MQTSTLGNFQPLCLLYVVHHINCLLGADHNVELLVYCFCFLELLWLWMMNHNKLFSVMDEGHNHPCFQTFSQRESTGEHRTVSNEKQYCTHLHHLQYCLLIVYCFCFLELLKPWTMNHNKLLAEGQIFSQWESTRGH